jgi:hydantoinase/carbamoylase family amidase
MSHEPARVITDLRELAERTGGPGGARRVAWTEEWAKAREWLHSRLAELPVEVEQDAAGNLWATLAGEHEERLVVGSHIDSVPSGGWLDGALGVCAGLEVLRSYAETTPPVTLQLVDWADEEGARFGRSLFGSSAAAGTLEPDDVRELRDADGVPLPDALAAHGVELDRVGEARGRLEGIGAYLELHIEQGPVLADLGLSAGAVIGTYGVERHALRFAGRAGHAGSTPLRLRHDAFLAAARLGLAARESAARHGGVATVGPVRVAPGVPTIINESCEMTLDQRAFEPEALASMLRDVRAAGDSIAEDEGVEITWHRIWNIEPIPFDPELVAMAEQACQEVTDAAHRLPSGALHDCAEIARLAPAVMVFAASTGGISHSPAEDTPERDLERALVTFARLVELTIEWLRRPDVDRSGV